MIDEYEPVEKRSLLKKFYSILEEIWPSIYRGVNSFIFGAWEFIKDTVSSIWRRY